ncbi:MAG: Ig-like domain-containing protein, partial [Planctomycetota bacterium]|nr:Ig-like domain-containing protein [Planctomycetota bacterium]
MFTRNVARSFPSGFPCCEAMEPRLLLAGDITITVTSQATADTTPDLSGTISDSLAAVKVRVAGTNYAAVNNGDGTWTLAGTELEAPLANGTYDVVALATNSASGAFGVDDTADELVINTISPIVAVNELVTNALRPALTGTVNDTLATVTVTVGGKTYTATNKKDGTWSLAANVLSVLSEGTYDVAVAATNTDGHVGTDTTADELTIDRTKPVVTVNTLATGSPSPRLTGTVDDPDATLVVTVNGKLYTPLNNADGTWTLAAGTISSLSVGHYDVAVTAFDDAGNTGADTTTNELDIQALPGVTMDALATPDTTPELTGSVSDPAASVSVAVDGHTYAAVNNGDGTWTLADDTIDPLADGNYDVVATAVLGAVSATDTSTYELVIDTADPVVTIDALTTTDTTPTLTGTVDAADETITVTVNGKEYTATNTGNGTWTLSGSSLTALTPGTYDVKVSAKDAAGNVGADSTTDELGIQPVVTVTSLTTTDTTPNLTGTVT